MKKFELYPDQAECVEKCLAHIASQDDRPGIVVAPTAYGKSLVVGELASRLTCGVLVLQLTSELLEQNFAKFQAAGGEGTIYCAGLGKREMSRVTFATLKSVAEFGADFKRLGVEVVIVDECDRNFSTKKGSLFMRLLSTLQPKSLIGLTATPWALNVTAAVTSIEMLTNWKKGFWKKFIYVNQIQTLVDNNRWTPAIYEGYKVEKSGLVVNSSGTDYTDESIVASNKAQNINKHIARRIQKLLADGYKHILVFTDCSENAIVFDQWLDESVSVLDSSTAKERKEAIRKFKSGEAKVLFNYGILGVGFDFPELEVVIFGRPTMSLSLWYQVFGRGIRKHPGKDQFLFIDFGGNMDRFDKIESLEIKYINSLGWSLLSGDRVLSGVPLGTEWTVEQVLQLNKRAPVEPYDFSIKFDFGKYKNKHPKFVPVFYLTWYSKSKEGTIKFEAERKLFNEVQKVLRNANKFLKK